MYLLHEINHSCCQQMLMIFNSPEVESIATIAKNVFSSICDIYLNPLTQQLIGIYSIIHFSFQLFPMYTPFFLSDSRSVEEMKLNDPEDAELLQKLTHAVHEQARLMGAEYPEKINVRFGSSNMSYGSPYSFGGPLLLISKENAKIWFADGSLNNFGKRTIGHELTHILEHHSFWSLPFRIMGIVMSCGLFIAMSGLIPSIPIISKVLSIGFLFFRMNVTGLVFGPAHQYFEARADRGAVYLMADKKEALKIAQGGFADFTERATKNLTLRCNAIEKGGLKAIWYWLTINDKGENRLDFMHPGYITRANLFNTMIEELSVSQMT